MVLRVRHDDKVSMLGALARIGRGEGVDLVLKAADVSRLHCRLSERGDMVEVEDLSEMGTEVNGERLLGGHRLTRPPLELKIGPFVLIIDIVVT